MSHTLHIGLSRRERQIMDILFRRDGRLEVAERFVGSQRRPSFERAIEAIR
jgi:hypothetical protein